MLSSAPASSYPIQPSRLHLANAQPSTTTTTSTTTSNASSAHAGSSAPREDLDSNITQEFGGQDAQQEQREGVKVSGEQAPAGRDGARGGGGSEDGDHPRSQEEPKGECIRLLMLTFLSNRHHQQQQQQEHSEMWHAYMEINRCLWQNCLQAHMLIQPTSFYSLQDMRHAHLDSGLKRCPTSLCYLQEMRHAYMEMKDAYGEMKQLLMKSMSECMRLSEDVGKLEGQQGYGKAGGAGVPGILLCASVCVLDFVVCNYVPFLWNKPRMWGCRGAGVPGVFVCVHLYALFYTRVRVWGSWRGSCACHLVCVHLCAFRLKSTEDVGKLEGQQGCGGAGGGVCGVLCMCTCVCAYLETKQGCGKSGRASVAFCDSHMTAAMSVETTTTTTKKGHVCWHMWLHDSKACSTSSANKVQSAEASLSDKAAAEQAARKEVANLKRALDRERAQAAAAQAQAQQSRPAVGACAARMVFFTPFIAIRHCAGQERAIICSIEDRPAQMLLCSVFMVEGQTRKVVLKACTFEEFCVKAV
eukprot:scaffold5894_cov19-Tisochrysis_lutea.AAC.8